MRTNLERAARVPQKKEKPRGIGASKGKRK